MPDEQTRATIVDRYGTLARAALNGEQIIDCGPDAFDQGRYGAAGYTDTSELPGGAVRASLGCGDPVAVADLNPGEFVLDLGSGGGIDVLLSARRVAPGGIAYGLDASPDMLALALANAAEAGVTNVDFRHGHIEDIPLPGDHVDVVISNCVINLSTDKPAVLAEAFRVLRPGGRFGVSDVIADDHLTPQERAEATAQVGCSAGALTATDYCDALIDAGFVAIEITATHQAREGIHSAIVKAVKPAAPGGVTIRPMTSTDADQVLAIYQEGLDTADASFETTAPPWTEFDAGRLPRHRFVAADTATGRLLGWAAATAVSSRRVYAGVVEHSVYVHPGTHNRGVGTALLQALIGSTEAAGIWTIQSGIFPENTASLALHHRAGFRTVGTRERIGQHHGRWRDVVLLERRATTIAAVREL
jgi:L-amino acid N-acyltransferase YncA/2-polyprenyl-3-methyl-5-hydroxy-6-metoxy-1,4-benzoquinol methylase